ncbi:unnamed protein product, partial [Ixodes pacificus]
PPKVLPLVIPKNLLVGERMSITCAVASGSKPLTFMWLRNDSALRGGTSVHIADSSDYSMLHIENLKIEHAGNYTCVVSNAGGTVSYSDILHVKAPPTWKTEPRDMSVTAGQKVSITCDGNGHPQPSVRWTKEGTLICGRDRGSSDYRTKTIELASASKEDQGSYTCEIANGIGEAIRKTITILVKFPPSIPPFQFPKNLQVGQRISVTCTISVGDTPIQFAWLKDGSALSTASPNIRIVDNAEFSTLNIAPLTLDSAGNYTCSVSNKAGYTSYTAPLVVQAPPRWIKEPQDVTATAGSNVTMTCSADGFPKPSVNWRK